MGSAVVDATMEPVPKPEPDASRLITRPFVSVALTAFIFFFYIGIVLVTIPRFIEDELGEGEFGVGHRLEVDLPQQRGQLLPAPLAVEQDALALVLQVLLGHADDLRQAVRDLAPR